jgi:polysaccharide biosynthesis/export protein VpsN
MTGNHMKKALGSIGIAGLVALLFAGCMGRRPAYDPAMENGEGDLVWMHVEGDNGTDATATRRRTDSVYRLKIGDELVVNLMGTRERQSIESRVDDQGNVTLPLIDQIRAEGLSGSQLARDIRETYISRKIYNDINVNILIPSQDFYYIRGEVRQPGRYPLGSGVTLMQAIAAAGGFTEYASERRTRVIRGDEVQRHNVKDYEKNPDRDVPVLAEDVIIVPRSMF